MLPVVKYAVGSGVNKAYAETMIPVLNESSVNVNRRWMPVLVASGSVEMPLMLNVASAGRADATSLPMTEITEAASAVITTREIARIPHERFDDSTVVPHFLA